MRRKPLAWVLVASVVGWLAIAHLPALAEQSEVRSPGLVAVQVPPGRHDVDREFKGFPMRSRLGLCALGIGAVAVLVMFDRRDRAAESDE